MLLYDFLCKSCFAKYVTSEVNLQHFVVKCLSFPCLAFWLTSDLQLLGQSGSNIGPSSGFCNLASMTTTMGRQKSAVSCVHEEQYKNLSEWMSAASVQCVEGVSVWPGLWSSADHTPDLQSVRKWRGAAAGHPWPPAERVASHQTPDCREHLGKRGAMLMFKFS